jgi:hypothetical protein
LTVRRLRDQKHVRLRADDRSKSFAEDRMIFDAQDANRLGGISSQISPSQLLEL